MLLSISTYPYFINIILFKNFKMSSDDQRAKRMANKLVKQHITSYVLDSITDKRTNHDELEKLCLTDSKISDIECLFNMKENDHRILITSMFETDKVINEITDAPAYIYPILTQDVLPTKKQISTSSSSFNILKSSSSNIKKSKLKLVRNYPGYKCLEKRMTIKQKSAFIKKELAQRFHEKYF